MNKRPGLDPFLEALAREYNTIVFTAAMPDYAGPVLDYIDPKGTLFHRRLYRSSCRQVHRTTTHTFVWSVSQKEINRSFGTSPVGFFTIFRLGANCSVGGYGNGADERGTEKFQIGVDVKCPHSLASTPFLSRSRLAPLSSLVSSRNCSYFHPYRFHFRDV